MGFFDSLKPQAPTGQPQQPQQIDPRQMRQQMQQELGQLKSGPGAFLKARGYTIPDGMTDANQITQHLIQTGQVGGGRYQQVMRMFGGRR